MANLKIYKIFNFQNALIQNFNYIKKKYLEKRKYYWQIAQISS